MVSLQKTSNKMWIYLCVEAASDNFRIILMYLNEKMLLDQVMTFPFQAISGIGK